MTRHWSIARLIGCSVVVMTAAAAAQPEQPAQASQPSQPAAFVRASLDHTAMWIADRVTYRVDIVCLRGVDILDDDMSKDKLNLDGLELVSSDASRSVDPAGRTTHAFTFVLTSYRTDMSDLKVGAMSVRYYVQRSGTRPGDEAPAGSVNVPAAAIALRSTLPDDPKSYALRDGRAPAPRLVRFAIARPVGLGLVVASIVPVAIWGVALATARRRKSSAGRVLRKAGQDDQAALDAVRQMDVTTPEGRRDAFTQINVLARNHLHDVHGLAGPSLTPREVAPALEGKSPRVPAATIASLLAACEQARYAPVDAMPSAEACRQAVEQAGELLAAR
jgi:hypothetical protein